jgi:hypothetical protein
VHYAAPFMMLDHTHCRAICDEIGDRLREVLRRETSEIPPRLLVLVDALARLEDGPSIVPSFEEMSSRVRPTPTLVRRSADLALPANNCGLVFVGT